MAGVKLDMCITTCTKMKQEKVIFCLAISTAPYIASISNHLPKYKEYSCGTVVHGYGSRSKLQVRETLDEACAT